MPVIRRFFKRFRKNASYFRCISFYDEWSLRLCLVCCGVHVIFAWLPLLWDRKTGGAGGQVFSILVFERSGVQSLPLLMIKGRQYYDNQSPEDGNLVNFRNFLCIRCTPGNGQYPTNCSCNESTIVTDLSRILLNEVSVICFFCFC